MRWLSGGFYGRLVGQKIAGGTGDDDGDGSDVSQYGLKAVVGVDIGVAIGFDFCSDSISQLHAHVDRARDIEEMASDVQSDFVRFLLENLLVLEYRDITLVNRIILGIDSILYDSSVPLTDRDGMLGIVASDIDTKKTSDFAFIDNFDFLGEFRDEGVAGGDGDTAGEDIVNVDAYNDISTDVDTWIGFESSKSHAYNNLR